MKSLTHSMNLLMPCVISRRWGGEDTAGVTAALPTRMSGLSMDQSQYEEQLAALSYGSAAGGDAAADTGAALAALQQSGSPLQLPPPQ